MRRSIVSGLVGLCLLIGAGGWWSRERPVSSSPAPAFAANSTARVATSPALTQPGAPAARIAPARSVTSATPPLVLSPSMTESLNERIVLHQLAADTGLLLSDEQWAALSEVTAHFRAVRLALEAEIAQVAHAEPGLCVLEVPAYAEAGGALQAMLFSELTQRLGPWTAREVQTRLGPGLSRSFGEFGASPQTLEFHTPDSSAPGGPRVDRRVWRPDGTVARAETSLPVVEDPVGTVWGPLLARAGFPAASGAL